MTKKKKIRSKKNKILFCIQNQLEGIFRWLRDLSTQKPTPDLKIENFELIQEKPIKSDSINLYTLKIKGKGFNLEARGSFWMIVMYLESLRNVTEKESDVK